MQDTVNAIIGKLPPIKVYPMTEDESILQGILEDDLVKLAIGSEYPINFGLGLFLIASGLGACHSYVSGNNFSDFYSFFLISLFTFCPIIGIVSVYKWYLNKEKATKDIDDKRQQLKDLRKKITSRIQVMQYQEYDKVLQEETLELSSL